MASPEFALRPELAALQPYNSGLTLADVASRCGGKAVAKLASNESPFGLPEEALRAMEAAIRETRLYPDPGGRELAEVLAAQTGVAASRVIFGDGSEDLLNILARATLRPGDEIVTLYPSFPLHEDYARMMGATVTRIGLTPDRRIDVDALVAAASRPIRQTMLANPMSPAGLWLSPEELDRLLEAQHPESVLCLDEAYVEYALGGDFLPATERLAEHHKPLLVLRTFSKAFGLAGLRIGYGLSNCDDLIRGMQLVRTPFNVNAVAQAAALAVLRHPSAMRDTVEKTRAERSRVGEFLRAMNLEVLPSKGNFLFVNVGGSAVDVADRLIDYGVIVKPWKQPGYETFIRVSIGLPGENSQFLTALAQIL